MSPKTGQEKMRRAQVINAALQCLAEKGFEELTLDMVAQQGGVSKGVLMYYFDSKKDMMLQTFRAFLEYYNEIVEAVITPKMTAEEMLDLMMVFLFEEDPLKDKATHKTGTPGEDSRTSSSGIRIEKGMMQKVFVHFYSKTLTDADFQKVLNEVYKKYYKGMKQILRYGWIKREFRKVDTPKVSWGLMALTEGMILYKAIGFQPLKDAETAETWKIFTRSLLK